MLYYERGSVETTLTREDLRAGLETALAQLGPRRRVLVIPPDYTRLHSHAGELTRLLYEYYGECLTDISVSYTHLTLPTIYSV